MTTGGEFHPAPKNILFCLYCTQPSAVCQDTLYKTKIKSAIWTKITSGSVIINRLCFVLWRMSCIVKYIPAAPPKKLKTNSVFSGIRQWLNRALSLSITQIKTAKRLIIPRYKVTYFIPITEHSLHHLHRFFNLLFKFYDNPFFQTRNIGLRNPQRIGHLFLRIFLIPAHAKAHLHDLFFSGRQGINKTKQ